MFLKQIALHPDRYPVTDHYPFNLPAFHQTRQLDFDTPVTLFVGENGAGNRRCCRPSPAPAPFHVERRRSPALPLQSV